MIPIYRNEVNNKQKKEIKKLTKKESIDFGNGKKKKIKESLPTYVLSPSRQILSYTYSS